MNYNIEGEPLPVVICNLEANETMITEKGAMSWMTPNMKMETTSNGGIGKMFGRAFSGENIPKSLHIYGWSGNDSICIMLSRMHQTLPDCTGTGDNCPEISISCFNLRS